MGKIVLRGGRLLDPESGRDEVGDLLVEGERIVQVGHVDPLPPAADLEIIDVSGLLVTPGLIDMHVHLREPGNEEEETIHSGSRAAVAGGITSVACFPNTDPAIDNEGAAEFVVLQGKRANLANVFPVGAATLGREGQSLSEMAGLVRAGAVAFSDADRCLTSAEMMRRGMLYAKMFGRPVIAHCEDPDLNRGGVMNYGRVSLRLGLSGIPDASENIVVARDIGIAQITQGRLHIGQMSTKGSVELLRQAKANRLDVTGEVTAHHLTLTDESCLDFNPNCKVLPPLREQADIDALVKGLREGVIDAIVSGHAPFGTIGMETLFSVSYTALVERHGFTPLEVIEKMTIQPARILGLAAERGSLAAGKIADISVFDVDKERRIDSSTFESKSRNTCFEGQRLRGTTVHVLVAGRPVVRDGKVAPPAFGAGNAAHAR